MSLDNGKLLPPYISFRTFINFLLKLELAQEVPPQIDRSFLNKSYSGSTGSQLLTALRFLGLIAGEDNRVTAELYHLVEEKEARKQLLSKLLHIRYAPVFAKIRDLSKATHAELELAFTELFKVDNETRRKAVSFFIHAAQEAEIPISKYIRMTSNPVPTRVASLSTSRRTQPGSINDNAMTQEFERADAPSFRTGSANDLAKTITLRKRENLILIYTGNPVNMDRNDRAFLFHLFDEMEDYAQEISSGALADEYTDREEHSGTFEPPL